MSEPIVTIQVFDLPSITACFSGGWGPSWSPEEITAIVRAEMEKRFGETASIVYHDVQDASVKSEYPALIEEIETKGLLYPVTVLNGTPVYDGAVSYPAILRAVQNALQAAEARQA